jgi:hypothetical protein
MSASPRGSRPCRNGAGTPRRRSSTAVLDQVREQRLAVGQLLDAVLDIRANRALGQGLVRCLRSARWARSATVCPRSERRTGHPGPGRRPRPAGPWSPSSPTWPRTASAPRRSPPGGGHPVRRLAAPPSRSAHSRPAAARAPPRPSGVPGRRWLWWRRCRRPLRTPPERPQPPSDRDCRP